jgi:hypothetical protein
VFESAQGADNKALSAACVAAKTAYPESKGQMAFCRDTDSDKFTCVAVVPGTANAAKVCHNSMLVHSILLLMHATSCAQVYTRDKCKK